MKKILLIAVVILGTAIFTGCDTSEPVMRSVDVMIKTNEWREVKDQYDNIRYLYVDVDFPEITRQIVSDGVVLAYVFNTDGMQEPLTASFWDDYIYQGEYYTFEEVLTFAYTVNKVRFYYSTSDFEYPVDQPRELIFRVVIIQ